jgi:hypothetical protein
LAVLLFFCGALFPAFSQESPIDLVLVLDTSSSMSDSYREVLNYVTGPFLREFLRIGDTFHLISFSDKPRAEISRRVEGGGDVEIIIGRLFLMYPLDPASDISGALNYSEQYVSSLPASRAKKVVFISDGNASGEGLINGAGPRFKQRGADFYFVKVPLAGSGPSSGRAGRPQTAGAGASAAAGSSAGTAAAAGPSAGAGASTGAAGAAVSAGPAGTESSAAGPSADSPGSSAGLPAGSPSPDTSASGSAPADSGAETPAAADTAVPPASPAGQTVDPTVPVTGTPGVPAASESAGGGIGLPLLIGLIIGAALIAALIVFLIVRNLQSSPGRVMASSITNITPEEGERHRDRSASRNAELLASFAANQRPSAAPASRRAPLEDTDNGPFDGPPMLNLFVDGQSTAIGRRNIHNVKPGYTFTIGGGKSDFLIFFVSIPSHIADIRYDGNQCTFTPRKPQYFPDTGSQTIPNCIGKAIRVISDKNYEFFIRLDRYQDPLIALNRLLHSIQIPEQ